MSDKIQKYELLLQAIQEKTLKWRTYVGTEWQNIEKHTIPAILGQDKNILADNKFFFQHSFCAIPTDVLTQQIIDTIGINGNAAFLGSDIYTEKIIISVATALLGNGKNCLIVVENETLLAQITNNFSLQSFADFVAQLNNDEYLVRLNALRQNAIDLDCKEEMPRNMPLNLQRLLQSAAGQIKTLQNFYQCYYTPLANYSDYSAALAAYLLMPKAKSYNNKLSLLLSKSDLTFSATEQRELLQLAQEGEVLWAKNTSAALFSTLHNRFYTLHNNRQVSQDVQQSLTRMLQATTKAQTDILAYLYQYEKSVEEHFVELYVEKLNLIRNLKEICEAATKINSQIFATPESYIEQSKSWFGKNKNNTDFLDLQKQIHAIYQELYNKHFVYLYVAHDFIDLSRNDTPISTLIANLTDYENKLAFWYRTRNEYLETHLQNLQPEHIHPHSQERATIINAVRGLELLTENINQARIFAQPFTLFQPSLNERLAQLALFSQNIQKMLDDWTNFEVHHAFCYFMQAIPKKYQTIFQLLEEEKCISWHKTLEYCYLHQALIQRKKQAHWLNNKQINQILSNLDKDAIDYQQELSNFIRDLHNEKRSAILSQTKNAPTLSPAQTATIFPITITSAEKLAELLPFVPQCFDMVIFADAQNMSVAEVLPARFRARFCFAIAAQYSAPSTELAPDTNFISYFLAQENVARIYSHIKLPPFDQSIAQIIATFLQINVPEYQINIAQEIKTAYSNIVVPLLLRQVQQQIAIFFMPFLLPDNILAHKWQEYLQSELTKLSMPIIPIFVHTSAWFDDIEKANQILLGKIQAITQ